MRRPALRLRPVRPGRLAAWLCLFLAPCLVSSAVAQEPAVPLFWQPGEAPPKPDLKALQRLRFLTADGFPPFNSLGADGRPAGFNVDLAREICAELGLAARCTVEARPFEALETALLAGEGDAVIAGTAVDARTRAALAFSRPYFAFPARFAMRKGEAAEEPLWQGLAKQPVGVVAGTAHERFLRSYFAGSTVTPFPDARAMLDALAAGRIRAGFGDGMRISFWLSDGQGAACCRFAGGPYLAPAFFGQGMAIAVRPEDRALVRALDYALQALAERRKIAELYFRWFPVGFF